MKTRPNITRVFKNLLKRHKYGRKEPCLGGKGEKSGQAGPEQTLKR